MTIKVLDIENNKLIKEEVTSDNGFILPRIGELIEIPLQYNYLGEGQYSNKCGRVIDVRYKPVSGSFNDWFRFRDAKITIEILCKFSEPYIAKGNGKNDTKYE